MEEEIDSLIKNNTGKLVKKPQNQKLVGCKWIYKLKHYHDSSQQVCYKVRLIAKDFTQKEGEDYGEIFSLVVRHSSIHVLLSLVTNYDLELE